MKGYDLVLHSMTSRDKIVKVNITPQLAWGIVYAFAMLDVWLNKYVGMRAHVLRPASDDKLRWHRDEIQRHDVRVCLDIPPDGPSGQAVSLVCMRARTNELRLFATERSANGLVQFATVDASPMKLGRILNMAQFYGRTDPPDMHTLEKYCRVTASSSSSSPHPFRLADKHWRWRNPLPRLEITEEFLPYISVRSRLLAEGRAGLLSKPKAIRSLVSMERQKQLAQA